MTASAPVTNFLSPSYVNDLERFMLLRRSIRRFASTPVHHVVAVPAKDMRVFEARLRDDQGVTVVPQQQFVSSIYYAAAWAGWLRRALGPYGWRLTRPQYAGRPGWIIQQIVKLSTPEIFGNERAVIVDSDLVFVRPFGNADFSPSRSGRLLLRVEPDTESAMHREHMRTARQLLALPPGADEHHYMAFPNIWYGDWVRALRAAIEMSSGKPWQQALFDTPTFSEYLLYGVFVEETLRPAEMQVRRRPFHVGIWNQADLAAFLQEPVGYLRARGNHPLALVVQSNLNMPVGAYEGAVEQLIARA
jgi:hypothetical protein